MIAANYRKHPEALALQLPLPFGWILKWATAKPTTKALRAIRTARGKAFAALGRIAHQAKPTTPQWVKDAAKRARDLAKTVKNNCLALVDARDPLASMPVFLAARMRREARANGTYTSFAWTAAALGQSDASPLKVGDLVRQPRHLAVGRIIAIDGSLLHLEALDTHRVTMDAAWKYVRA